VVLGEERVSYVLRLAECTEDAADRVGGKALGLGRLVRLGPDVPEGFVIATDAYRDWLARRGFGRGLEDLLSGATTIAGEERASQAIGSLFQKESVDGSLAAEVAAAYAELGGSDTAVAVRSSATAEDTGEASFAGQQETYLGVVGLDSVLQHIVRCWASLFTPQAISYRRRLGIPVAEVAMAVVVQRMVAARVSGVMITIDPVNGDRSQISIEGAFGLGQPLVGGELTPDRYCVDKVTMEIRSRSVTTQPFADLLDSSSGTVSRTDLAGPEGSPPCLEDEDILRLAEVGKRMEQALGGAVDIEWAIGPGPQGGRHLYLLQARPETVWSRKQQPPVVQSDTTAMDRIASLMLGKRNQS
jgi:phosphoenolpyruvate synthase/pyruvate phosphate dikinase